MSYNYASAADSYSSYPVRASVDSPTPIAGTGAYDPHANSQGYSRAPHHDEEEGEEYEDEDWNVYDDFNMTRPAPTRTSTGFDSRPDAYFDASKPSLVETPYSDNPNRKSLLPSEAFGFDVRNADPRRSIITTSNHRISQFTAAPNTSNRLSGTGPNHADSTTGIELITVPALGNEYTKEELKEMTRGSKRRRKRAHRKKKCALWVSGEDHLWGWLSPRVAVFIAFFFCVALAVLLFFVIPRVPSFAILSTNPVVAIPNGASMSVSHSPTNFSMEMGFNLRASNQAGWIPTQATDLTMQVTDLNTYRLVGKGSMDSISFKGRGNTEFMFPVQFSYVSLNASGDQTWQDFYQGCGPNIPGVSRPTLNLGVSISMKISELLGRKGESTQVNNVACPFTLQSYQ